MPIWMQWVWPGLLARSPRPGYLPGAETAVPRSVVDDWTREIKAAGIASILCLLDQDQLPLYDRALPGGLLQYYADAGFAVGHVPARDEQLIPFTPEQLEEAWQTYLRLPKPVLVHCSAGYDRTGRVVAYLLQRAEFEGRARD